MKSNLLMKTFFAVAGACLISFSAAAQQGIQPVSMTLEEAVAYAIENSYQMAYADMDVRAASRRNKELTAIGLPQINGDVSFTNYLELPTTVIPANAFDQNAPEDQMIGVQFGTEYNATATLAASQMLFDGTYFLGLKAAKTFIRLNQQAGKQSENELRRSITEAYGLAILSIESHQILNENYNSLEGLLGETEKLFENGFREELDVDQLRLQLATLDNGRKQAERNVMITHNLLKFQMGMPVAQELLLTSELDELAQTTNIPQMLETNVNLEGHSDVLTSETNLELRNLNVKVERMAGVPKLHASFTTQQQAFRQDLGFFGENSNWYPSTLWGLQLQVPIFSGFMRHNKVQQAKIDVERAKRELDQVRESIQLEVLTQKANYATALDVYQTEKENMALAEKINSVTRKKYEEGISSSFEIQQAETQMLNAQSSYLQSAFEVIRTKAALEKALDIQ